MICFRESEKENIIKHENINEHIKEKLSCQDERERKG